jgi:hypothetical protein
LSFSIGKDFRNGINGFFGCSSNCRSCSIGTTYGYSYSTFSRTLEAFNISKATI